MRTGISTPMTVDRCKCLVAFLQSIPPVKNAVAGPFAPGEKVTTFVMRILPPGETVAAAPK